jgi:cold shock CspA family protein
MKAYKGVVKWFDNKPKERQTDKPKGIGFLFMSLDSIQADDEQFIKDLLIQGKTKARIDETDKMAEIFFHVSGVIGTIEKGSEVEFNLREGHGAPLAFNIKRI